MRASIRSISRNTDPALYFTRWITHFCAPVFVLLAGVSVRLAARRLTPGQLRRFLFTRGLWLIALEFTLVNFAWNFNLRYDLGLFLQVIWALGASMVVLAALVRLPLPALLVFGLVLVCGHNVLDGVAPAQFGRWAPLWSVLHVEGPTPFGYVSYPLIPWVGVMALGYVLGTVYTWEGARRRRTLLAIGAVAALGFIALRMPNLYGDPHPWLAQRSAVLSVLSFLNVEKYPPSLLYLLVTLGPALVALALLEGTGGRIVGLFETFGRVPLFLYVLHIALAHLAAGLICLATGFGTAMLGTLLLIPPPGWGFGLPGVYLAWILLIAALYPACRWFAGVKQRRKDWWLSYL